MLVVSDQQFSNKLKIWLKYSCSLIAILYISIILIIDYEKSVYNEAATELTGIIHQIKKDENRLQLIVKNDEKIIANYYNEKKDLQLGDRVLLKGRIRRPNQQIVFNLFNYRQYLKSQKIYWLFNIEEIILLEKNQNFYWHLRNRINNHIEKIEKTNNYINNFVLAQRNLDSDVLKSFKTNGTMHLLAISGAHIAFLILILNKLKINKTIINLLLLIYLITTNFAISLTRAVLFYYLTQLNKNIKLETLLLFLALFLLVINPFYIYDIGFQFSFIISFFLIHFRYVLKKNYLYNACIISIIAFLASMPILINNFFEINLLTPLLNLIFVPIFTIIIYPLSLVTFIFPIFDNLLYNITQLTEKLSLFFAQHPLMITMPKPNFFFIICYYLLIYFTLRNKKIILLIIFFIFHKNIAFFNQYGIITFIDVGQGDSILIETPRQETIILIDTGGIYFPDFRQFLVESRTIPYLKSRGIKKIDLLVLTHGHYDHLGEAITLLENFSVAKVVLNSGFNNAQEKLIIEYMETNKINYRQLSEENIVINNQNVAFLSEKNRNDENEDSLVLHTIINNHPLLFMGDAGFESENYIMENYDLNNTSLLKIGHHGSKYSTSEAFIKATNPKCAVITAGINNRFNHPHQEVIEKLETYQIEYLNTAQNGSIKVKLTENLNIFTTKKGN